MVYKYLEKKAIAETSHGFVRPYPVPFLMSAIASLGQRGGVETKVVPELTFWQPVSQENGAVHGPLFRHFQHIGEY